MYPKHVKQYNLLLIFSALSTLVHRQNVPTPRQNVSKDKTSQRHKSQGQNVQRGKTSHGQNVTGQIVPRDKTS